VTLFVSSELLARSTNVPGRRSAFIVAWSSMVRCQSKAQHYPMARWVLAQAQAQAWARALVQLGTLPSRLGSVDTEV
jgi:hypothetical protein